MELLNLLFTKQIIIYFIIGIIIYIILYFISKTILKIFTFITTLLLIIILIIGFFAINDAIKFSNTLKENTAIFLLEKNSQNNQNNNKNFIAGLKYNFNTSEYKILNTKEKIEYYKKNLEEKKYKNNTFFIITTNFLKEQNFTLKKEQNTGLPEFLLDKNKIIKILESKKPLEEYANLYYDNHKEVQIKSREEFTNYFITQMKQEGYTNTKIKSEIFSLTLAILMKNDPSFLFKGIKEKKIKIYPERIFIKLLNYIPEEEFNKIINYSTEKIEKKITS